MSGFVSNITRSGYDSVSKNSRITIDKVELLLNGNSKGKFDCYGTRYAKNKIALNASISVGSNEDGFQFDEVRLLDSSLNLVFSSIKKEDDGIIDSVLPNKISVILNFNLSYQTIDKDYVYIKENPNSPMSEVQLHELNGNAHGALFDRKLGRANIVDSYRLDNAVRPASAKAGADLEDLISASGSFFKQNEFQEGENQQGAVYRKWKVQRFRSGLKRMEVTYINLSPFQNMRNRSDGLPVSGSHEGGIVDFILPEPFQQIVTSVHLYAKRGDSTAQFTELYGEPDELVWSWELYFGDLMDRIPIYFRRWTGGNNDKMDITIIVEGY